MNNPKLLAFLETFKEFMRWALSYFIGWVIDNGYAYFTKSNL
jgi:hypothetical protein